MFIRKDKNSIIHFLKQCSLNSQWEKTKSSLNVTLIFKTEKDTSLRNLPVAHYLTLSLLKFRLLDMHFDHFYWIIGWRSDLSLANKKLTYMSIFKKTWTYSCEIWGVIHDSNLVIIERFQNKFMRSVINVSFYITNEQLCSDLGLDDISVTICKKASRYIQRLHNHPNVEAVILLDDSNNTRHSCRC